MKNNKKVVKKTIKNSTSKKSAGKKVAVGMGVAAGAAALALGAYYLYGPKGKENRTKLRSWMLKAKGEVMEKLETMKDLNREAYDKAVEAVAMKYSKIKDIDSTDVAKWVSELKGGWNSVVKGMKTGAKKAVAKKAKTKSKK